MREGVEMTQKMAKWLYSVKAMAAEKLSNDSQYSLP